MFFPVGKGKEDLKGGRGGGGRKKGRIKTLPAIPTS